jgi:hypothetical protein
VKRETANVKAYEPFHQPDKRLTSRLLKLHTTVPPKAGWEGLSTENEPEDLPVSIFTSTSFRVKSRDEISLSYPGPFHFSLYFIVPKVIVNQ